MAKGYRAKHDVSYPRVVARTGDGENDWVGEGTNYAAGQIVPHDSLPPRLQQAAEAGELGDTLEPMEDDDFEYEKEYETPTESGIFVAEHEAEAHALRMGGHHVIPKSQVLESLSAGQDHAARYQELVAEHGLDRRPAQEAMARAEGPEGRVPDHLLQGLETRSGLPHDRGPAKREQEHEEDDQDEGQEAENENESATRARPPVADQGQTEGQE